MENAGKNETHVLLRKRVPTHLTNDGLRKAHDYKPPKKTSLQNKVKCTNIISKRQFYRLFPILTWLPSYDIKNDLMGDLIAGVTVAVLQIPHGLAFAPLGGQEPVVGLYMAIFPLMMYVIFGTSRHISLGMMAILIMMVGKVVDIHAVKVGMNETISEPGYSSLEVGMAVTFTIGLWQILLGILQLGSLCVLLSNSLVSGLTAAASIHIVFLQFKHIFGVSISMSMGPFKLVYLLIDLCENIQHTNLVAFGISVAFIVILYAFNEFIKPKILKRCRVPIPMEFILIVAGIILSIVINMDEYGVTKVGKVPGELPQIIVPPMSMIPAVAVDSFIIALVSISINISLAKVFAKKGNYELDQNQELLAYGMSNAFGGFFQCLPVTASLSRSMVQFAVGGKTCLAHAFSLLSVLLMLLFLGPILGEVPMCVLAAIVIVTIKGLFMHVTEFPEIWRNSKLDGAVWLVTFVSVIIIDIDYGIGLGLVTSLGTLVYTSVKFQVTEFNHDQSVLLDTNHYRPSKLIAKNILILKIVAGINFFNHASIFSDIYVKLETFWGNDTDGKTIILDMSAVPYIDACVIADLITLKNVIETKDSDLILTNCSVNVYHSFENCDMFKKFPKEQILVTVDAALRFHTDKCN